MTLADDGDLWIENMSGFYAPKKLHALGAVTFLWNACETGISEIFEVISGIPYSVYWIMTRDINVTTLCGKLAEVAEYKKLPATTTAWLVHTLKVFDHCRRNRNQLTHFAITFESQDGNLQMAINRRSKAQQEPIPIPERLEDIRRVADEIAALRQTLTDFFMFVTSQGGTLPWPLPDRLPLPALLETPPQSSREGQPRPP